MSSKTGIGYSAAMALVSVVLLTAVGCASDGDTVVAHEISMMPIDRLPIEVQRAAAPVREAYQFAAANPGILKHVPCYCGCGGMGHTSVLSCYVANGTAGTPSMRYDGHALGCSICVDIALDALRLTTEGASPEMIRVYIDLNYARFGTSNMS